MARPTATAVLPRVGRAARRLAVLLALAVLAGAAPLPLVAAPAAAVAPVGEEGGADVESVSSACPRRAVGLPGHAAAHLPAAAADYRLRPPPAPPPDTSPAAPVARGPFRPHPRC